MKMNQTNEQMYILCEACGKPVQNFGTIKLNTIDPTHHYKTSKRKFLMNYKWKLCPVHFKEAVGAIEKAIKAI